MESNLVFAILTFFAVTGLETLGKPQDRSQNDNAPRWSTQRSNFFPGADQDLTLTLIPPNQQQQQQNHPHQQQQQQQPSPKLIFPSRFQPIVGTLPGRGPRYQEQESRVQHNYYPAQEFARGSNLSPIYQTTTTASSTATTQSPSSSMTPESTTVGTRTTSVSSFTTLPTSAPAAGDNREIRFLIHKPGDEEIIKRALYEDSLSANEQISFIQGPTIKLEQKQKVVLPPKRKTVVYVFIKEPEIETKVEMVEPPETPQDQPQVFIFYQKANGANKGLKEHYPGKAKMASASVNLGGPPVINPNKLASSSGKAPSASNQISQSIDPPPPGCPTGLISKN